MACVGKKKTQEEFDLEMKELHPDIEVLEPYINSSTALLCRCKKDGYEWKITPNKLINSLHGCPQCGGSLKLSPEIFESQMKEINPNIVILESYVNSNTPIMVECLECGNRWKARPYHLKQHKSCPSCSHKKVASSLRKSLEQFKQEMEKIDPTIKIIGSYKNSKEKIECECLECGNIWHSIPLNLLKGRGCSKCAASKGEKRIAYWLRENNIEFEQEYIFQDCKDKRPLPFDFYIKEQKIAIEYDGQQHFYPTTFGGISKERALENFNKGKSRDSMKDRYCKDNNIKILRIPYWDYNNIDTILSNNLNIQRADSMQRNS